MATAFALGLASFAVDMAHPGVVADDATVLDTYYPMVLCDERLDDLALLKQHLDHGEGSKTFRLQGADITALSEALPDSAEGHGSPLKLALKSLRVEDSQAQEALRAPVVPVLTIIEDIQLPAVDAHDVYLRLHLLSHRKIVPHGCNLDGIFGLLANVAWTDHGPHLASQVDCLRAQLRMQGKRLTVQSVDKFPRMTDYVVPTGVRIADADRVRLGAHLAEGTTIMHEGFVNFNAGTLGNSMVEGRISAGVVVGDGSDVGGGASIMGTLSGGGKAVISIGKNCLLGANAGIGISLGNGCTVEAGTYITAGAKVRCTWNDTVVKAAELSGHDGLLFRRNSVDGSLQAIQTQTSVELNEALHAN